MIFFISFLLNHPVHENCYHKRFFHKFENRQIEYTFSNKSFKTYLKSRRSSIRWTRMKMWRTGRSIILIVRSVQNFFMRGSMSAIRRHAKLHFSALYSLLCLILESDSPCHIFRVYFPFYSSSFRSLTFDWLACVPNNGFSESL